MSPTSPAGTPDRGTLAGALDAIATGAARAHGMRESGGNTLVTADVRAAARRRRTRFGAGVGLAAATVVGALVLGGAALIRADRPEPPADSPTPSEVSVTGACGQVLDDLVQPAGGPDVEVSVEPKETEFRSGDPLSVVVEITVAGAGADGAFGQMTSLVLARDGVVVGVPPGLVEGRESDADTPQRQVGMGTATFASCGADGEPTDALAPGDYDVVAIVSNVMLADGDIWAAPFVSNRAPVRVLAPDGALRLPMCGASTDDLVPTSGVVTAGAQVRVGIVDDAQFTHLGYGATLAVDALLANNGPDLFGALGIQTELVVAQDGLVVASGHGGPTDPRPVDWPAGGAREEAVELGLWGCADGFTLAPGDYVLWLLVTTSAADTPDGETRPIMLIAPPVPFHVYAQDDPENVDPVTYTADDAGGWADVDLSAVPTEVPLALEGTDVVVGVRAHQDGRRWDVSVYFETSGDRAYANARAALLAAGFAVVDEDTETLSDGWAWGNFTRDGLTVRVDTATTGAGWGGDYLIVRTD